MTNEEIVKALRCLRVETGSLSCLGCGYEHSCNVHGCQILREAAAQLEHFTAENRALRSTLASRPEKRAQKQARDASITFLREMAKELNAQRAKAEADKDGRVVVLPCKVGERWTDEDGRAVRITAVIVSIEPFGMNINIYFDYEDATPDDAGSDCMANWDYFSRHYTCIEIERATEGAT